MYSIEYKKEWFFKKKKKKTPAVGVGVFVFVESREPNEGKKSLNRIYL